MARELGVRLVESIQTLPPDELPTAVPVFIGEKPEVLEPGLHSFQSFEQWSQAWRREEKRINESTSTFYQTVRHYFDNGGGPCFVLMVENSQMFKEELFDLGIEVLKPILSEPAITLVAVPIDLSGQAKVATQYIKLWKAILSACESRPDLFFVFDTPRHPEVAKECINLLRGSGSLGEQGQYVALYGPHLRTDYKINESQTDDPNNLVVVPPCGAVISVIQRTDQEEGIWKAPANVALAHVVEPEYGEAQAKTFLHPSQMSINSIRGFPGRGVRVWGCRTLASASHSSFCYVQVRRLITYIGKNLAEICRFAVFETNNEITWFKLKGLSSAWLRKLWHRGGLAGTQESQAFEVLVGLGESMTTAEIELGKLIVKVRVAVLHAAEFIDVALMFNLSDNSLAPVILEPNVSAS